MTVLQINSSFGRMICPKEWSRTRENSLLLKDLELWIVWKGRGWMNTHQQKFTLLPGFCAIMRPGGIYDAGHDVENPLGIAYIHFDVLASGSGKIISAEAASRWPEFLHIEDFDYLNTLTRRIIQTALPSPPVAQALLSALLEDLISRPQSLQSSSKRDLHQSKISRIVATVQSRTDALPSVEQMAAESHMSPAHFSRVFRKITSQSPKDFLLQTRLSKARHLLAETDLSITEIAERLAYSDVFFFSRQFKQKIGVSPTEYRRQPNEP